ncbi:diguanylate cyclase (GGDEF)-like protein [Pseudoduganella lurida]|uniref:diguanylate cyclase n=1 Tax=Pseudoduganella lurida TaxID=1036180 RepID=A0A562REB5_9BURK|nr:GGDEF domain-containing protein [Pseudoduganella lurida]TWI67368.1 diguanylate cyclase (GGDEF)-like protein [Pseudoduganella lurida]
MVEPDLFAAEYQALVRARETFAVADGGEQHRRMLGELMTHYERLMRETRRLIQRSDRAEREMQQLNRELQQLASQLQHRASHDPMTGALNRGALIDHATHLLQVESVGLIVLDIDHFKRINDEYGHPVGDAVICAVVDCLQGHLPRTAVIGRVGGEEFSIVCPGIGMPQVVQLANTLCSAVAQVQHAWPITRPVTASLGAGWYPCGTTFPVAYSRADAALYRAKRDGRNLVRLDMH